MSLYSIIMSAIQWVLVPLIMLALWFYAISILSRSPEGDRKTSARAGFWAGMVLCAVFIVSQLQGVREPTFSLGPVVTLSLVAIGFGLGLGFVFLLIVRFIAPTPVVGLLTLILASASSITLYSYFLIPELRRSVASLALGFALGALLHLVFFPSSAKSTWG